MQKLGPKRRLTSPIFSGLSLILTLSSFSFDLRNHNRRLTKGLDPLGRRGSLSQTTVRLHVPWLEINPITWVANLLPVLFQSLAWLPKLGNFSLLIVGRLDSILIVLIKIMSLVLTHSTGIVPIVSVFCRSRLAPPPPDCRQRMLRLSTLYSVGGPSRRTSNSSIIGVWGTWFRLDVPL